MMPGPISDSYQGLSDHSPYVPAWCYDEGPLECVCGHHEGFHNDAGECLQAAKCGCAGLVAKREALEQLAPLKRVTIDTLVRLLSAHRYRYRDEAELQTAVAMVLDVAGIEHRREHSLSEHDRPDFFLPLFGLVIEVKCRGAIDPALRQVDRYMAHDAVQGVLLASGRAWGRCGTDNSAWRGKSFDLVFLRRVV